MHGAGLANAVFSPPGAHLLEIALPGEAKIVGTTRIFEKAEGVILRKLFRRRREGRRSGESGSGLGSRGSRSRTASRSSSTSSRGSRCRRGVVVVVVHLVN